MKHMVLTDQEANYIYGERAKAKHKKVTIKFRKKVLRMALEFSEHLESISESPSFNEFINFYNPPHHKVKNRIDYEAVLVILQAVKGLEYPVLKDDEL